MLLPCPQDNDGKNQYNSELSELLDRAVTEVSYNELDQLKVGWGVTITGRAVTEYVVSKIHYVRSLDRTTRSSQVYLLLPRNPGESEPIYLDLRRSIDGVYSVILWDTTDTQYAEIPEILSPSKAPYTLTSRSDCSKTVIINEDRWHEIGNSRYAEYENKNGHLALIETGDNPDGLMDLYYGNRADDLLITTTPPELDGVLSGSLFGSKYFMPGITLIVIVSLIVFFVMQR